jgi:hypothetical protein
MDMTIDAMKGVMVKVRVRRGKRILFHPPKTSFYSPQPAELKLPFERILHNDAWIEDLMYRRPSSVSNSQQRTLHRLCSKLLEHERECLLTPCDWCVSDGGCTM